MVRPSRSHALKAAVAALFVSACTIASCASEPATGFDVTLASLLDGAIDHVVVRVYGDSGTLVFCKDYAVDEARAPGETVSLVHWASTFVLAPGSAPSGPVRVAVDAYTGPEGSCDTRAVPFERKVAIARYAEGKVLPLRMVFDLACANFTECDELVSTCSNGKCVNAEDLEASGVSAGPACFDIGACPNLTRATKGTEACNYTLPANPASGYVAVAFRFAGTTGGDGPVVGAAVLSQDDFVGDSGNDIALVGRICELERAGNVSAVYFGYECLRNARGATLCPINAASDAGPLATVATGGGNAPGTPDGGQDSTTAIDARADVATDASIDARGDTVVDARTDGGGDSGGDSGQEGGRDSSADATQDSGFDGGVRSTLVCRSDVEICPAPDTFCCSDDLAGGCYPRGMACNGQVYECDDLADCGGAAGGFECCRQFDGIREFASCVPQGTCEVDATKLCSLQDLTCLVDGDVCQAFAADYPGKYHCVGSTPYPSIHCPSIQQVCDSQSQVCCYDSGSGTGTCANNSAACAVKSTCDDHYDCAIGNPAHICCGTPSNGAASCGLPENCTDPGAFVLCSRDDTRCPSTAQCTFAMPSDAIGVCQ